MSPRKKSKLTAEKLRELQVAAAVAREAILQTHVARALKLIELAGDRVSALRMIAIYTRVHAMEPADAEVVGMRVLATIGSRARKGVRPAMYVEGEEEPSGQSLVGVVRDRLRGRVHHDIRRWVELHTGSTKVALLEIYVKHGLLFIQHLDATHGISQALELYADMVELPRNMREALYIQVLDRIAAVELPRLANGPVPARQPALREHELPHIIPARAK